MQVRAIMRNPQMAAACGINVDASSALTFAYGSGLAGVAGVHAGRFQDRTAGHGHLVVVDGFLVVVVGGVGSLIGTIFASLLLGQINGIIAVLYQRHPGAGRRLRRGHRADHVAAEGSVFIQGALRHAVRKI